MTNRKCLAIVLAAGEGTRMKSSLPKVLHPVAGLPMIAHVLETVAAVGGSDVALVVGNGGEAVEKAAPAFAPKLETFRQEERKGTAHAVLAARDAIARGYDDIVVLYGDAPLIEADAILSLRKKLAEEADIAVLGFRTPEPTGYGRLIEENGKLVAIREEKDCTEAERAIDFCNSGLIALSGKIALDLLTAVGNANAKREFYLTDVVEIACGRGLTAVAIEASEENALGVNTRAELAEVEAIWQRRRRREMMLAGVTLIAPETVFFSHDTEVGADTLIEPNVWFGPGVSVGGSVRIHAFCHVEQAKIADNCEVGPFARLRPGADLRKKAKVGNFCEIKKAVVDEGAKVNHLAYIGDAFIGAAANIGAGTITCNYDGFGKFETRIGAGAFIGSNSALVAPVSIGREAYVASGSVITEDVPDDALAFGRARQATKPGRGKELRQRFAEAKKAADAKKS
ncbi:MAG TPA: bifunctional UDP-N-acetylglucosamine diphosphorylase/glucosamine-1-phosphate N-acetyltransferase GlmU [Rhizobiaceae bacterium]|nr:bifunctional UDP-N-acetylglucosamine diphosphorylase/glucosamine-1-phosphate N-acetyltransferase GlmU [Rhizobiaceae bacterium]